MNPPLTLIPQYRVCYDEDLISHMAASIKAGDGWEVENSSRVNHTSGIWVGIAVIEGDEVVIVGSQIGTETFYFHKHYGRSVYGALVDIMRAPIDDFVDKTALFFKMEQAGRSD